MNSDDPKDANQAPGAAEPTALSGESIAVKADAAVKSDAPSAPPVASQPSAGRKLAPPPKPARESRPSTSPPAAESRSTSSLAPRAPMIVVGQTGRPPRPSASAAAWTRPPSEPSDPSMLARAPATPRRDVPPASVEALRAKLDFGRERPPGLAGAKSEASVAPPRAGSRPDEEAPRADAILPPPRDDAVEATRTLAEAVALEASEPHAARAPAPVVRAEAENTLPSEPATEKTSVEPSAEVTAEPAAEKTPVHAAPKPEPVAALAPSEPAPPAVPVTAVAESAPSAGASEAEALSAAPTDESGERRRSAPARRRSGPPRPRLSSSAGLRPRTGSSRPGPREDDDGSDAGAVDVPSAPKMPEFVPAASAATASDEELEEGQRASDPPVPAPAIAVMKIIATRDGEVEIPIEEDTSDIDVDVDVPDSAESHATEAEAMLGAENRDELEEIPVEDLAPDSGERLTPIPSGARDSVISIPPLEVEPDELTPPPAGRELDARPPPPPKRSPPTPPKPVPQPRRRQKRAWWEDIFGDDFVRANFRVSETQIVREVDFIEESLGVASGGVVLDLGCGPGHHAVELASRGYGVVGYDLSLYQLALASDVAQERGQKLNFLQGDMREMAFDEMFDGIFSWNTSFGYFEEEKNGEVAERVFRALRPGGMFLIDVVNRDFVATQSPCSLWYEGDSCVCMDDMNLDFITSRMRVKRSVILDDGRTRECVYSIRVYSLHELGKLLHDVGFRVTEASGHPSTPGVFFGEFSPRIIVLAQKP